MRPVTAAARIRGREMRGCTPIREYGATIRPAAITSARHIGMIRKIAVQMKLFDSADQNTGSSTRLWKLASPAHTGVPTPSQKKNAAASVSSAGTRMMQTLMSSAGSANSHMNSSCRAGRQRRHLAVLELLREHRLQMAEIGLRRDPVQPDLLDAFHHIAVAGVGPERPGGEAITPLAELVMQVGDGLLEQGIADALQDIGRQVLHRQ